VGEREADLIERIRAAKVPAVLAINKCDTVEKASLLAVIDAYAKEYDFKAILPISAKTGEGVEELLAEVTKLAPEGPQLFPEDMITDQPERQLVAEILREKLLWCLEREVPHGTAVEITAFNEREDGVIDIDATIYCEKSSHKGIIIGKRGEMLKKISSMAREDCEKLLDSKVYLQTWVKVKENWRESNTLIRNFGYQ
ncbi:MAG: GTPase Era, partial [Oscillospiraceae bacterium]|nr:GTPase Era [Oscillospiraceae bacterium]